MQAEMNRETWLNRLAALMAPKFAELGHQVPHFRVSIGFTAGGRTSNANGECWHSSVSADKAFEILITPDQHEPMMVANILFHELTHAAVGFKHGHKGEFAKVVAAAGLQRPFTATTPGPVFMEWVQPLIDSLGPLPHAPLMFRRGLAKPGKEAPQAAPQEGAEGADDEVGADSSNAKKKQTTRLIKATCQHDGCGYNVRVTRRWLEIGPPHCPLHGAMHTDDDVPPPGDDDGEE